MQLPRLHATRHAVDAGLSAARVEHAITHMRGIRPDIVANDTTNASACMLLEAKTEALCLSNYSARFAANGDTWMKARARKCTPQEQRIVLCHRQYLSIFQQHALVIQ
jgi:hypothetical protein